MILFDMDGVLLDTEPLYTIAFDRALAPFGARLDARTKREIMGRQMPRSAAVIVERFGLPCTAHQLVDALEPEFEQVFACSPAMPGAQAFVEQSAAQGYAMAVATSSSRRRFEIKTRLHPWFARFEATVCGDDPEVHRSKPAPDIFLVAARRLGVRIEDCLVIEDSPLGVAAGKAAGAKVVAFVRDGTPASCFPGADQVVATFDAIDWS